MTIDAAPPQQFTELIDRLTAEHAPAATRDDVVGCVRAAWEAIRYFGAAGDAEIVPLAERIAERELRLRLGLEREIARLDPEDHHR